MLNVVRKDIKMIRKIRRRCRCKGSCGGITEPGNKYINKSTRKIIKIQLVKER